MSSNSTPCLICGRDLPTTPCEGCGQQSNQTTAFMPEDVTQPFFAYGIFKPGEIAYFQIKRLEPIGVEKAEVSGALRSRDGVLLLVETHSGSPIQGWRITFKPGVEAGTAAYQAIGAMEPRAQYRWGSHRGMNVLYARSPNKGSEETSEHLWRGSWDDGAFTHALRFVEESISDTHGDPLAFYRLQSAHLLLWSSIERYASLRYGLGANINVVARVAKLAEESASIDSLQPSPTRTAEPCAY